MALAQQEVLRAVEDVLPTLNAMVSNLLGWASVHAHLNPLKPKSFVHALRETLARHIPEEAARATVMPLAAGKLGVSLRQLYREISDWLRSQGVDPVHAARQFLERMTHRSLAFSSHDEPGFARFCKTFENAVKVLSGGAGDAAAFARVLRKLEDGWSKEERAQRARAQETARSLLYAQQRNLLAQRLASEYTEQQLRQKVPATVLAFLRGPWSQVVADAQLTHADGSVDPFGYQGLVDDLIWSVQIKLTRRNPARLVQMVLGMLVKMRQGLHLISYPPERIGVFFDELITLHEKVFEGLKSVRPQAPGPTPTFPADAASSTNGTAHAVSAHPADFPVLTSVFTPEPDAVLPGPDPWGSLDVDADSVDPGDLQDAVAPTGQWLVERLNTGSWVDLAMSGVWVRAQLTWASPQRTLFMFISGGGMAHSMSRRTLERLKDKGLVRLFSDGCVMDNALDAVAQMALRNDLRQDAVMKSE